MPPTDRYVISFAAEPPQEALPYGRWADTLRDHFLTACRDIVTEDEDLGDAGEIAWFPDRSYAGRTYVPAVARTTTGYELFGFVSFTESGEQGGRGPVDFETRADYTSETAETNPEWKLDINDEVVAQWRGEQGNVADMTLVWGVPMVPAAAVATAVLGDDVVDACVLEENRFTLLAPDGIGGSLQIAVADDLGSELAREELYDPDDED
jgi:hypothetical protein